MACANPFDPYNGHSLHTDFRGYSSYEHRWLTLLGIDLVYIPRREMRWTYWQDALCEIGWLAAWARSKPE